jgi:hypothetical protein
VDLRVAVDLARGRDEEARAVLLGQAERVVRAVRADLQRVQRDPQVVDRRRRRGEVVDEVHRLVDEVRLDDVDVEQPELRLAQVRDVLEVAGLKVVDGDDAVPAGQQRVTEVGAEEAGSAGHEGGGHAARQASRRHASGRSARKSPRRPLSA